MNPVFEETLYVHTMIITRGNTPALISTLMTHVNISFLRRYYIHAYGSVYGIAGHVVAEVIAKNAGNLRLLANEGGIIRIYV